MSTRIYDTQSSIPSAPPRSPTFVDDTGNHPRRTSSRSNLSDRLRNVFRRGSSSPNRTASNDRRPMSTISAVRQDPITTTAGKSSPDTPQLRAPMISWPFGKKKNKSSTTVATPKTNKKKTKATQQTNQSSISTMEISPPLYPLDNQQTFRSETFIPRTPEIIHSTSGRLPPSSSGYEITTTKGFRDYVVIDQSPNSQQVVVSNVDNFTPSPYTSDRSRSPSMNRQRFANTSIEHSYYHDNSTTATGSIPMPDIEVIRTPQQRRHAPNIPTSTEMKIVTEKPPMSSRPPSAVITNPPPWKSTSTSTLNNSEIRSTKSSGLGVSTPRLNAPTISFGGTSNKKAKRTKSQTRTDGMSTSLSTINQVVQQNPTRPNESWKTTYGSLPDAEIIYGGSSTSLRPSKNKGDKYPGISAIVQHHMRRPPVAPTYQNGRIFPTPPIGTPGQRKRFETSTSTILNEYEDNQIWPPPITDGSKDSSSPRQRQDGYIRPMTPTPPPKSPQPDVRIIRVDIDGLGGRSPPTRPSRYDTPEPPTMYRSSTTVYTRDKHQYVDGGEIRTWSAQENNNADDYPRPYRNQPFIHVQVDVKRIDQTDEYDRQYISSKADGYDRQYISSKTDDYDRQYIASKTDDYDRQYISSKTDDYDRQYVSSKTDDHFKEYRYSPRVHEEELYEREDKIVVDPEIHEEERYEVSYEYERHDHQQYAYESKTHYDQLHSTHRYTNNNDDDQNLTYTNLASSATERSAVFNEREKVYDQPPRSYSNNERVQEVPHSLAPAHHPQGIQNSYTLKRSKSYDGLGISVAADSQTRSNHYIREVERGSPADRAGLRANDRIISINGISVENIDFNDVLLLLKQGLDNDNLQLSVIHELDQI